MSPAAHSLLGTPDICIAHRAAQQWGILSAEELRECGLSNKAISGRARNGRLHRMHRGVYAVGHANPPLEGRWLAAVKACGPGAVLSHYSAAALWDLVDWDSRCVEVTVSGTASRAHPSIRVHRTQSLPSRDRSRRKEIPVTAPARTLLDLSGVLGPRSLRRAVRLALVANRVTLRQLAEVLGRAGRRRGVRALGRIVAGGHVPTRSELEDIVLDLLLQGGFVRPDVNVPLVRDGRRVIPDFRWPKQRLVVEADGAAWHDNPIAREDDAERQALLEAHGERVMRVSWHQATVLRAQTLARFAAAGAPVEHPLSSSSP